MRGRGWGRGRGRGMGMGKGRGRGMGKGKKPPKLLPGTYFENLKKVVMEKVCSGCSACVAACPRGLRVVGYDSTPDFPEWVEDCIDCGFCVRVCPRWSYKPQSGLGSYVSAFSMKSRRFKGQDGAAVTEIIVSAMEAGIIDAAVVVGRDESWKPYAMLAKTPDEVVNCSGTKYSIAYPLSVLKGLKGRGDKKIAVVGTPCVVSGVRKLQLEMGKFAKKIALVVGLFCMENFFYPELAEFLKNRGVEISSVEKMDIKKGKFIVYPSGVSFPVKELDEIVPSGCKVCQDFTAIESDVSVGSVGSPDGYSIVLLRNPALKDFFDSLDAEFGDANVDVVKKLADFKVKIHPT